MGVGDIIAAVAAMEASIVAWIFAWALEVAAIAASMVAWELGVGGSGVGLLPHARLVEKIRQIAPVKDLNFFLRLLL